MALPRLLRRGLKALSPVFDLHLDALWRRLNPHAPVLGCRMLGRVGPPFPDDGGGRLEDRTVNGADVALDRPGGGEPPPLKHLLHDQLERFLPARSLLP